MNNEKPYRDQAERLRKKVDRVHPLNEEPEGLPPRSRLHKKKYHQWKLKYPVIRLLVLFFVLLPVIIFAAYPYLQEMASKGTTKEREGYETISLEERNRKNSQPASTIIKEDVEEEPPEEVPNSGIVTDINIHSEEDAQKDSSTEAGKDAPLEEKSEPEAEKQGSSKENEQVSEETADAHILLHTVAEGENLFRIALKYYQSQKGMEIIKEANNLMNDTVMLGQVLKIPIEN